MKLTKKQQYGLLLCLYVSRGGRVTISAAAESLRVPTPFLEQIARTLRLSGILKSVRGPGGGYELNQETIVYSVLRCLGDLKFIDTETRWIYCRGGQEEQTFLNLTMSLEQAIKPILDRKIVNLCNEYAVNQMKMLNNPSPSASRN